MARGKDEQNVSCEEIITTKRKRGRPKKPSSDFSIVELLPSKRVGRPAGAGNKIDKALRERMNDFLQNNFEQFEEDYNSLTPHERAQAYVVLYKHHVPQTKKEDETQYKDAVKTLVETTLF